MPPHTHPSNGEQLSTGSSTFPTPFAGMSLCIGQGGGVAGRGAGGRRGGGGGRDGDDGHRRNELWKRWVCSAAAKKRGARRWTNWGLTPPPSLHDYAPGGRYFRDTPELVHGGTARARIANGGEGSSGGGGHGGPGYVYARTDAEEKEATAAAIAESEALIAEELAAERREHDAAIAAVVAMEAREASPRR